jgi:hypothetical protein
MAPGPDAEYLTQFTAEMEKLMKMSPQEKAEYTARMRIKDSETLGKGKGTKRTNQKKLTVIEEMVSTSFLLSPCSTSTDTTKIRQRNSLRKRNTIRQCFVTKHAAI